MNSPLRVAVVGAGIADKHVAALRARPALFEVPVLCSLDVDRGRALSAKHGVAEFTTDFESLLRRADIDAVDICTPPSSHYSLCERALAAGKHVICEKPLFGSLAEVDRIAAQLRPGGPQLMPIFQYRFGAGLSKLRHLVALGLAGEPIMSTVETHWWRGPAYYDVPWRGRWATELGGGMLGHAIHAHDMLTCVHGDIAELFAFGATRVNAIEVEDTMALSLRLANGSLATLSMTLGSREEISRLRFCFKRLSAESALSPYAPGSDPWRFVAGDEAHQHEVDAALAALPLHDEGFVRQFELFHEALCSGGALPVTLADARRSLELVTAAYHSQRTGQAVKLPLGAEHPLYESWLPQP
jgi:predicted dehydrogenase